MEREEGLWDANQTADVLGVKPGTVYDWAARNILPCVVLNRGPRRSCIRFEPAAIREFIKARTSSPRSEGAGR